MKNYSEGLKAFLLVVSVAELLVSSAVAVVLGLRWRHHRSSATASAFGVFFVLALVIALGYVKPADPAHGWGAVYGDVLVSVLVLMPFLLVEFTWVLGGIRRPSREVARGLLVVQVVTMFATPPLPQPGEPRPGWSLAVIGLIVFAWGVQSVIAARGLWRLGEGQSSVVRHRMRALSTGALLLAGTLILSGTTGSASTVTAVVVAVLGLMAILLYAVAFLVPASLRLVWRQDDVAKLAQAENGLMRALSLPDVADTIVPVLAEVFGGSGAALLDRPGNAVRTSGVVDLASLELARMVTETADGPRVQAVRTGVLAARLTDAYLVVEAGRLAPVFGNDEQELLGRVATLVDLALQRVALFDGERANREAAETANAELETLLYSVPHDLRSPLISVLGYLDFLRKEHGSELTGDGPHYLERISVNALYMQSLISDLLELSRIGRIEPDTEVLDLGVVAQEVVDSARIGHPDVRLDVVGELPSVRVSDVRMRQLITNLIDNALKYGDRDDLQVTVSAAQGSAGEVLLRVGDNGRGIPPEYRARVLRVFERLDAPKSSPGTGIGLAICKRIAESLGGSIVVDGPAAGVATGTTVEITLPASIVVDRRLLPAPRGAQPRPALRTPVEEMCHERQSAHRRGRC